MVESLKENLDVASCFSEPVGLKEGDRIRTLSGPFADFLAEIEHGGRCAGAFAAEAYGTECANYFRFISNQWARFKLA